MNLKYAITAGVGLFITIIGLEELRPGHLQ